MKRMIFRLFTRLHVILYRLSGGRIGGSMSDVQILLLESVGRKTDKKRTMPPGLHSRWRQLCGDGLKRG